MSHTPSLWWLEMVGEVCAYAATGDLASGSESFAALCDHARDTDGPAEAAVAIGTAALRLVEACCRRGRVELALDAVAGLSTLERGPHAEHVLTGRAKCVFAILQLARSRIDSAERLSRFRSFKSELERSPALMEEVGRVAPEVAALLRSRESVDESKPMRKATVAAKRVVRPGVELILAKCPHCGQGLVLPVSGQTAVFLCEKCLQHFGIDSDT